MDGSVFANPLRGVIPPLVTPLLESDVLDSAGLERLLEHVIGGGVHGIFILGTTGEGPSLSYRLRRELIERTCRQVAGRVPVLVGVTDSAPAETQRMSSLAADAGAAAVVLAAPFYFPISQADLVEYFSDVIPQLPLPVFLYNMPTHTKVSFSAELVREVLSIDNLAGLKDSAPGAACFHAVHEFVTRQRPDFSLLIGPEELMCACVQQGAHGGVCGGANLLPQLFVDLYTAAATGDRARAATLQSIVVRLAETVYASAAGNGSQYAPIRAIKRGLSERGICGDTVARPLGALGPDQGRNVVMSLECLVDLPSAISIRG